jgi:hypothetical protein
MGYAPSVAPVPTKRVAFTLEELMPAMQGGGVIIQPSAEQKARHVAAMRESARAQAANLDFRKCGWTPCSVLFKPTQLRQRYCGEKCLATAQNHRQQLKRKSTKRSTDSAFHASNA